MKYQHGFAQIILVVILVVAAIGGAYYFGTVKNKSSQPQIVPTLFPTADQASTDNSTDWKTYSNSKYGFSFQYPSDTNVSGDINGLTFTLVRNNKVVTVIIGSNSQKKNAGDYFLNQINSQDPQSMNKYVNFIDLKYGGNNIVWASQDPVYFKQQTTGLNNYLIATPTSYVVNFNVANSASLEPKDSLINQILSTFKFDNSTATYNPPNYTAPSTWTRFTTNEGLELCLPSKWVVDEWGNIYFNRDSSYRPTVTYVKSIPYNLGSRREAYFKFWASEYPNVRDLVVVDEVNINGNTALLISSKNQTETKLAPDGSLAVVWFGKGKLWKASLSNWSMINSSKSAFLSDFYKMISCSF